MSNRWFLAIIVSRCHRTLWVDASERPLVALGYAEEVWRRCPEPCAEPGYAVGCPASCYRWARSKRGGFTEPQQCGDGWGVVLTCMRCHVASRAMLYCAPSYGRFVDALRIPRWSTDGRGGSSLQVFSPAIVPALCLGFLGLGLLFWGHREDLRSRRFGRSPSRLPRTSSPT